MLDRTLAGATAEIAAIHSLKTAIRSLTLAQCRRLAEISAESLTVALTSALHQALTPDPDPEPLQKLLAVRSYPKARTISIIELLESKIRGSQSLTLAEGSGLISAWLQHDLTPASLRILLLRTQDHHRLAVRKNSIQLRGDVLVDMLELQRNLPRPKPKPKPRTKRSR